MTEPEGHPEPAHNSAEARAHDLLGVGFLLGDGDRMLHVNEAAARILGRSVGELLEVGTVREFLHPDDERRIAEAVEERRARGDRIPERFSVRVVQPDATPVPVELWVKAEVRGDVVRTYTLIHEVGELWTLQEGLTQLALTDPLTHLANRMALEEHLKLALARLTRSRHRSALLFLDLDGLKRLNDTAGHSVGDAVLVEFASRLSGALRPSDTAARIGGDEFVALVPELNDGDVEELVHRVREATTFTFVTHVGEVNVCASIGSVVFDDPKSRPAELIALADARMYDEKSGGAARP